MGFKTFLGYISLCRVSISCGSKKKGAAEATPGVGEKAGPKGELGYAVVSYRERKWLRTCSTRPKRTRL